ncbi:hypothetical protein [Syntrophomonas curvata]
MAQSIVPKKEEKIKAIFDVMTDKSSLEEFKTKFKEMFPKDWQRIIARYNEHEKRDTKRKGHPMPNPEKYLQNMFNTYLKK